MTSIINEDVFKRRLIGLISNTDKYFYSIKLYHMAIELIMKKKLDGHLIVDLKEFLLPTEIKKLVSFLSQLQ